MSHLVIVESPAKCKKIGEYLGPDFRVLATMGHIRALEEDLDAVGLDRDFEPRFRFLGEKSKATKAILDAARGATQIYLAADDDREGEAIAYSVACLLKRDPLSLPRSVFHEITSKAVRAAIANPRRIDMNRVNAQQARAVLDMMVGFTISPLLWKHCARGLSAGRCQTPALRIVCDRETEVKAHTTETSWALSGIFTQPGSSFQFDAKMDDALEDQESALNYLENIHTSTTASISSLTQSPWTSNPPKPLITSTLQQEASALFHCNPKATMRSAQSLYEAGHITYMRTDHAVMSEEAITAAQEEVRTTWGADYVGDAASARAPPAAAAPAKKKKAATPKPDAEAPQPAQQEAHEAIRPTHFENHEVPGDWSPQDRKIYALIWRRACQSVMSAAKGQTRKATLLLKDDPDFPWTAQWRHTDFQGWQICGKQAQLDDQEEETSEDASVWKKAQALKKGDSLQWTSLKAAPKQSRAPPRFTEATLIRELEKRGIGRPSTFASLVDTLSEKNYVEKTDIKGSTLRQSTYELKPNQWPPLTHTLQVTLGAEKQKLVPTPLGVSALQFCVKEFPQLFAYEFTAQMEQRLDLVSKGEEAWKQVCRDTWNSYKSDYERLSAKSSKPSNSDKVKDFGNGFKAVMSKKGPLLLQEFVGKAEKADKAEKSEFFGWPPGVSFDQITEESARAWLETRKESQAPIGMFEDQPIEKKKGPYGYYYQCGTLRVPAVEGESMSEIVSKLSARKENSESNSKVGPYIFAKGKFGPYMYKADLKQKTFVSIPAELDPSKLTVADADALYKNGLEAKKAAAAAGRGGRGGARGARGGRGGRGGRV